MKRITVVGLGYGDLSSISLGAYRHLQKADKLYLRTKDHPIVQELQSEGISFFTFDHIYEEKSSFEEVYESITMQLLAEAEDDQKLVYAVPGHPLVAEKTVQLLLHYGKKADIEIDVEGSPSFLDIAFSRLQIDPIEGFSLLDGSQLDPREVNPRHHILIGQIYDRLIASDVKITLMDHYHDEQEVWLLDALGVPGKEKILRIPLFELDRQEIFSNLTALYIPPVADESILYGNFDYLTGVIATLRSPEGCPWDQKQTHQSLRPYLLEETYEFLEALDQEDPDAMAEELGDILLQILLHSQIASESGDFSITDVVRSLTEKMIRRHPHVFGQQEVEGVADVVTNWDEIKKREKEEKGVAAPSSLLDGIPETFPLIMKAYEQNKRAAKVGFDWERMEDLLAKLKEEIREFQEATTHEERENEMGDILFTVISLSRFMKIHPELALQNSVNKFDRRFRFVEARAAELGKSLKEMPLSEMDQWWNRAKSEEK